METNAQINAAAVNSPRSNVPSAGSRAVTPNGNSAEGYNDLTVGRWGPTLELLSAPRIALPLLSTCGVLLFIVNLGGYALYTKGETREAVTVFDIVRNGSYVLPMRAGVEVPSKPLMMHWLAAMVSLAAGQVNEWTVRLPSAVFAILGLLVCYWYVRRLFNERSALIAALMLGTSCQYLQAGGARVDMTLTFFLEIALFHFIAFAEGLSQRIAPFYLAIAGAVLTKGPIGLALPALVAAIWMIVARRTKQLRTLRLGYGALIVGAIAGSWYLAAIVSGGTEFVQKQLLAENLYRLFRQHGFNPGHAHPFYYIEGTLLAGFMPWTPIAVLAALYCWKRPPKVGQRFGYLLVWFLTVLIFYNFPHSKRGIYLLALYPALCAIVALLLCDSDASPSLSIERGTAVLTRFAGAFFTVSGVSAFAGLAVLFYWPTLLQRMLALWGILLAKLPSELQIAVNTARLATLLIPAVTIAIGVAMLISRTSMGRLVAGIVAGTTAITLAVNLVIQPALAATLSTKDFAIETGKSAGGSAINCFGSVDYGFVFYSGHDVKLVDAREFPGLIVGPEEEWPLMPSKFRAHYRTIWRSNPTDVDGTGRLVLLRRNDAPS
jgi:4-amino-4-deoxy-L-arabinose transferase-like glycosyltransferase